LITIVRIGERRSLDMGVLMFQISNYHEIINEHDPIVLNKVLVYIAKVLHGIVRSEHKIYRYSHNTFLVVLNRSSPDDMLHSEQRIIAQITKNHIEYNKKPVTLALGIARTNHQKGDTIDTIIRRLEETKESIR
jgi:diguanylate cyclase (GGDEF)-like protein